MQVLIPAPARDDVESKVLDSTPLVPISSLDEFARQAFSGTKQLNRMQV